MSDPKRILLVEDHEDTALMMRELLRGEGYQVDAALTGAEAVACVKARPPDLILMDVMLPDADGLDLARRFAADPGVKEIPVVLVTALSMTNLLEEPARRIPNVRRILYKPCRPQAILDVVSDVVRNGRPRLSR